MREKNVPFVARLGLADFFLAAGADMEKEIRQKIKEKKCVLSDAFLSRPGNETMRIGYARVSTADQHLDAQRDALRLAGCERVVEESVSGAAGSRPGLDRVMDMLRPGDAVVVWRLDRLGRSLSHLLAVVREIEVRGAALVSLTESLDTTSPGGRLVFHVFAALAEFERGIIRERTRAGLAAARARGRVGGRPKRLDASRRMMAVRMYLERTVPVTELCRLFHISKPTLYAYVREAAAQRPEGSGHE